LERVAIKSSCEIPKATAPLGCATDQASILPLYVGKQLAAVFRIKALWRLHCCGLPVLC
jgi:hypothetical protein